LFDNDENHGPCAMPGLVENCATYDSPDDLACTLCNEDYFLDSANNLCDLRENTDNCEEFEVEDDECTVCETGFILDDGNCEANNETPV